MNPKNPYEPPEWVHGDKPWIGGGPPRPRRSVWSDVGVVLAVLGGIVGLAVLGFIVMFANSLDNWGGNK